MKHSGVTWLLGTLPLSSVFCLYVFHDRRDMQCSDILPRIGERGGAEVGVGQWAFAMVSAVWEASHLPAGRA